MDQDSFDAESTRDLRLSRWWIPAIVVLLAFNLGLVALAVSQPRNSVDLAAPGPESRRQPAVASQPKVVPRERESVPVQPLPVVSAAPIDPAEQALPAPGQSPVVALVEPSSTSQPERPASLATAQDQSPALLIVNPPLSGGPVHYALDGEVFTLQAGQYHRLAGSGRRQIEFDKGDEFGYTQQELDEGAYLFQVGPAGWSLEPASRDWVQRITEACRPIE